MSLDTWGTVRALLWLMVGYVAWRLMTTLPSPVRLRWVQVAVILGVAMALLGFAQAAAGRQPTLRFHPFHNEFGASGTFANRNHFALLMAMLAPLAIGLARLGQSRRQPTALGWYAAGVVLVLAAALSFSRAGFLLAAVGSTLAVAWAWRWQAPAERRDRAARRGVALVAAGALTVTAVTTYAWTQLAARLEKDPLDDLRFQYLRHGLSAVKAYLPWGSGAGSFRWAYAPFEPAEAMVNAYALHAHNELVEVPLELGAPGLLLLVSGLAVIAWTSWQSRQARDPVGLPGAIISIAIAMPLMHSVVDYPLRALSVLVVFAGVLAQFAPQGSDLPSAKKPFN